MKIVRLFWLIFTFLSLSLTNQVYSELNPTVSEDLKFLSSDELKGRQPGTEEFEKATSYIEDNFKKIGLKTISSSYRQNFKIPTELKVEQNSSVSFNVVIPKPGIPISEIKPRVFPWVHGNDWTPFGNSISGKIDAEIFFAGYGITAKEANYDDYANIDVKGKVVIVLTDSPDKRNEEGKLYKYRSYIYKSKNAFEHGAAAVLFVKPQGDSANNFEPLQYLELDNNVNILALQVNRTSISKFFPNTQLLLPTEQKITLDHKPLSFKLPNVTISINVNITKIESPTSNVIGLIEGTSAELKNEYILIGAHYDHLGMGGITSKAKVKTGSIHNGADDNASGVASMIELARRLALTPLKRSIIFVAFTGEEMGLLGSKYLVNSKLVDISKIETMINLDMVGRLKDNKLTVGGLASGLEFDEIVEKTSNENQLKLIKMLKADAPSDQKSFYNAGVPSLLFFTGFHDDYHTPGDDFDKINFKGMEKIINMVEITVKTLDNLPKKPEFHKVND